MSDPLDRIDFGPAIRFLRAGGVLQGRDGLQWLSLAAEVVRAARGLRDVAREAAAEIDRLGGDVVFLKGLIHDLREERGLPQPQLHEWAGWLLSLPARVRRAILRARVDSFERLCRLTAGECLEWKNFGMTSLTQLKEALVQKGLTLRGSELPR